jgi:hypothetical protein
MKAQKDSRTFAKRCSRIMRGRPRKMRRRGRKMRPRSHEMRERSLRTRERSSRAPDTRDGPIRVGREAEQEHALMDSKLGRDRLRYGAGIGFERAAIIFVAGTFPS